jgi:hypothetical protein
MEGQEVCHVEPSEAELPVSNVVLEKIATDHARDKRAAATLQAGRVGRVEPMEKQLLVTYQSRGRQTWVKKQSQKVLLSSSDIAVGEGGAPANEQIPETTMQSLSVATEGGTASEEDREAAVRWMDASDLLSSGEEPEDISGGMDPDAYFSVPLSESVDSDNTRDRTALSIPVEAELGPQLEQEASSGSLKKDLSSHEVSDGGNSEQCIGAGGGARPGFEPEVEDQQGDVGLTQAQVHEEAQIVDMLGSDGGEELLRIKAFCAHILRTLAPPLLREVESANKLRADAEPFTPRRVTRRSSSATTATPVPASAKPTRKASVAETVLLKALGFTAFDLAATDEELLAFKRMFDSPVCDQQLRVMAALFGKTMPVNGQEVQGGPAEAKAH